MIPFQTVLALLAVLMMFGCSQEPPPKPKAPQASTQATGNDAGNNQQQTSSGTPTPNGSPVPINKVEGKGPDGKQDTKFPNSPEINHIAIDTPDANTMVIRFSGQDAYWLFLATNIAPKFQAAPGAGEGMGAALKTGAQYQCRQNVQGDYDCRIKIKRLDGSIDFLIDPKQVVSKPGLKQYDQRFQSLYLCFKANPEVNGQRAAPFFEVQIYNNEAMMLYNGLNVGEIDGSKYGRRIRCDRNVKKAANDPTAYGCFLYGSLADGQFEEILLPKPKK